MRPWIYIENFGRLTEEQVCLIRPLYFWMAFSLSRLLLARERRLLPNCQMPLSRCHDNLDIVWRKYLEAVSKGIFEDESIRSALELDHRRAVDCLRMGPSFHKEGQDGYASETAEEFFQIWEKIMSFQTAPQVAHQNRS